MANCRNCGHELKPDLRFCSNCGTQVEAVPESFTPVQEPVVAGAAPSLQGGYTPPGQTAPTGTQSTQGGYAPGQYNPSTGAGSTQGGYVPPQHGAPAQPTQGGYIPPAQGGYVPQPQYGAPAAPAQGGYQPQGYGAPGPAAKPPSSSKKRFLIIGIVLAVVIAGVVGFIFLRGDSGGSSDDPNIGMWIAESADMSDLSIPVKELFEKGFTIELKAKGKCALDINGTKANGKWTLENGKLHIEGGGLDYDGTIKGGVLTLEDVLGSGATLTFKKEGGSSAGTSSSKPAVHAKDGAPITGGHYMLETLESEGEVITADMFEDYGIIGYYVLFNDDGSGELFLDDYVEFTWTDKLITVAEFDSDNPYTAEGNKLTAEIFGMNLVFTHVDEKPPKHTAAEGNETGGLWESDLETLHNTTWYGWIDYSNVKGNAPVKEGDIFDVWCIIGYAEGEREYFEAYQIDIENPVITFWADIDDHVTPLVDEGRILDHDFTEKDISYFTLFPYGNTLQLMYPYETPDGTWGCDVNLFVRIEGEPWESYEVKPPNYEEFKDYKFE